jgi:predicted RND superfamily exporter protein
MATAATNQLNEDDSGFIEEAFVMNNVEDMMKGNEAFDQIKRELDSHLITLKETTDKDEREYKQLQHSIMPEPNFNNFVSTNYRMFSRDSPTLQVTGEI